MITYKITNKTNTFGKRDINYNRVLSVEYVDKLMKKTVTIKPNQSVYLVTQSLPLSVHRLRMKNLVIVETIDNKEAEKIYKKMSGDNKKKERTIVVDNKKSSTVSNKMTNISDDNDEKSQKRKGRPKKNDDVDDTDETLD